MAGWLAGWMISSLPPGPLLPKLSNEINASAQDGILDAALVLADKGPCDVKAASAIVTSSKMLTGRPVTLAKAKAVLMKMMEVSQ